MWWDRVFYVSLGVFLLIYAIIHGTNIRVVAMDPISAICAAVAAVLCFVIAVRGARTSR